MQALPLRKQGGYTRRHWRDLVSLLRTRNVLKGRIRPLVRSGVHWKVGRTRDKTTGKLS